MIILFYIATIAAVLSGHMDVVQEMAGNDLWFYPLFHPRKKQSQLLAKAQRENP